MTYVWRLSPSQQARAFGQVYGPLLEEIFDALGQAKVFSTLDLRFGYHRCH